MARPKGWTKCVTSPSNGQAQSTGPTWSRTLKIKIINNAVRRRAAVRGMRAWRADHPGATPASGARQSGAQPRSAAAAVMALDAEGAWKAAGAAWEASLGCTEDGGKGLGVAQHGAWHHACISPHLTDLAQAHNPHPYHLRTGCPRASKAVSREKPHGSPSSPPDSTVGGEGGAWARRQAAACAHALMRSLAPPLDLCTRLLTPCERAPARHHMCHLHTPSSNAGAAAALHVLGQGRGRRGVALGHVRRWVQCRAGSWELHPSRRQPGAGAQAGNKQVAKEAQRLLMASGPQVFPMLLLMTRSWGWDCQGLNGMAALAPPSCLRP